MAIFELEPLEMDEYFVEVITGKRIFSDSDGSSYAVCFPGMGDRDMARLVYLQNVKKLIASGVPTKKEMKRRIRTMNLLTVDFYQRISVLESQVVATQRAKEISNSKHQVAEFDYELEMLQNKLYRLRVKEVGIMMHTAEARAEDVKIEFLVSSCTLKGGLLSDRYWDSYDEFLECTDAKFINIAKRNFIELNRGLPPMILRCLSRSHDWRRRWKASKQTGSPIFNGSSSDWDKNKVEICYWSDFYDSIFSYHTPPSEDIINDDDSLFEWIREVNRLNNAGGGAPGAKSTDGEVKKVNSPYKIRPQVKR